RSGPPAGLLDHIAQEIYDMHLLNYERLMDRVNEMLARFKCAALISFTVRPNLLQNIFLEHWWRWHNLTTELRHAMARADSLEPAVQRRIEELTAQAREARDAMEGVQAQIHAAHHPRALHGAPGTV
ncbi:hypothetical protein OC835_005013, partial [Tilletia horrida]